MSEEYLPHDWFPRPLPSNVRLGEGTWLYSTFAFLHYESEQPCGLPGQPICPLSFYCVTGCCQYIIP